MKKLLIYTLATTLLIAGCSSKNISQVSPKEKINQDITLNNFDKKLDSIVTRPDFAVIYDSFEKLVNDSDIIVEGDVLETSYLDFNTVTYTRLAVKVTKTYNNKVKEGDVLTFVEPGGITTKENFIKSNNNKFNEKITEEDKNTKVQIQFAGAPLTQKGEKLLLFGVPGTINVLSDKYYDIVGAIQGKFVINGDNVERFVPKDMESASYVSISKMKKVDLENKLDGIVKSKLK